MESYTAFNFTLPQGYIDQDGKVHRCGVMRPVAAEDEKFPLGDIPKQPEPDYFNRLLLSRVITRLGDLATIPMDVIANLSAPDLAYLRELYDHVNGSGQNRAGGMKTPMEKENRPGPDVLDRLRGPESLSSMSMEDVKVHYNSEKPAQLSAMAYTEQKDIAIALGQKKHLPHEPGHIVQQRQGRTVSQEQQEEKK